MSAGRVFDWTTDGRWERVYDSERRWKTRYFVWIGPVRLPVPWLAWAMRPVQKLRIP